MKLIVTGVLGPVATVAVGLLASCAGDTLSPNAYLGPWGSCTEASPQSVPTFADVHLSNAVRTAVGLGQGDGPLLCRDISRITELWPQEGPIGSLAGLQNLTGLRELYLEGHEITDIAPLARLDKLEVLWLSRNEVSDLSPLSDHVRLTSLLASRNRIVDLGPLRGLGSLELLHLGANFGISELEPLRALSNLRELELTANKVSDLSPLSDHANLWYLWLGYNEVSDLGPLMNLHGLRSVWLGGNPVSCTDVTALASTGVTVFSDCP